MTTTTTRIFGSDHIVALGYAVDLLDAQNCYVAAGATVGSENKSGINSDHGRNRVEIYGNVVGAGNGVYLGGAAIAESHDHTLFLHAGGQIYGYENSGVVMEGYSDTVINQGYVFGGTIGAHFYSAGSAAGSSLTNSGTIEGGTTGVHHSGTGGGTLALTNSGTIKGATNSYFSQGSSILTDRITNTGKMIGDIALSDGADFLDTRSGTVAGVIDLGAGDDTAYGSAAADSILAGHGNDIVRGGSGKDTMDGGAGIDTADYSDRTQKVAVTLNGANAVSVKISGLVEDTIKNFERVVGGSAGDILIGDAASNTFKGAGGKDTIDGGAGSGDRADYSDKTTKVSVTLNGSTSVNVSVNGVVEDSIKSIEHLTGGSAGDVLIGDAASNSFKGLGGKDTMDGAGGSDTADYSDKAAIVLVTLNGATAVNVLVNGIVEDRIKNFENLIGGSGWDALTGDALANRLTGNAGNDTLIGAAGNDTLVGGLGADGLTGGADADVFLFNAALGPTNIDVVTDFSHVDDTMQLENAIFAALGAGPFVAGQFLAVASGHAATTGSQLIIYDKSTGGLWYDDDGAGAHAAVQFATLGHRPSNVDFSDFVIV